ncbi:MAG TPA: AAA family ATPase [Clostridia bacterium]
MEAVIFIGIQATGKSTFYKDNFFKTHIRINLDMLKTRNREDILLEACIKAKQPFVTDNTNPTPEDRKKYISKAKDADFKVIGYYFQSSIDAAVKRNEQRYGSEHVPLIGIRSTHSKLQLPDMNEGFDELYYVHINEENKFVVVGWENEI